MDILLVSLRRSMDNVKMEGLELVGLHVRLVRIVRIAVVVIRSSVAHLRRRQIPVRIGG